MEKENVQKETKGKILKGFVVSPSKDSTAVVSVERYFKHPLYKKYITKSKRYKVHDPEGIAQVGDKVLIAETKPISKTKRFKIMKKETEAK